MAIVGIGAILGIGFGTGCRVGARIGVLGVGAVGVGVEFVGEGISVRLVSADEKEPGRVLRRGNTGRVGMLIDLPLVFPEELLRDEYAAKERSVSFAILDRSLLLRVIGAIFAKCCTLATVYRGLGYELSKDLKKKNPSRWAPV